MVNERKHRTLLPRWTISRGQDTSEVWQFQKLRVKTHYRSTWLHQRHVIKGQWGKISTFWINQNWNLFCNFIATCNFVACKLLMLHDSCFKFALCDYDKNNQNFQTFPSLLPTYRFPLRPLRWTSCPKNNVVLASATGEGGWCSIIALSDKLSVSGPPPD